MTAQQHQLEVLDSIRPLLKRLESDVARKEVVKFLWATVGVHIEFEVLADITELVNSVHSKEAKKELIGFLAGGEGVQLKVPAARGGYIAGRKRKFG
jgi:hypothetical protein